MSNQQTTTTVATFVDRFLFTQQLFTNYEPTNYIRHRKVKLLIDFSPENQREIPQSRHNISLLLLNFQALCSFSWVNVELFWNFSTCQSQQVQNKVELLYYIPLFLVWDMSFICYFTTRNSTNSTLTLTLRSYIFYQLHQQEKQLCWIISTIQVSEDTYIIENEK